MKQQEMGRFLFLGLFACLPLLLGTTYVLKERGAEVKRFEEQDGEEQVKVFEAQEGEIADTKATVRDQASRESEKRFEMIEAQKERSKLEKDKEDILGIREGMARKEVEERANTVGARRYPTANSWRSEYRYDTEHFEHFVLIEFDSYHRDTVKKVEHSVKGKVY